MMLVTIRISVVVFYWYVFAMVVKLRCGLLSAAFALLNVFYCDLCKLVCALFCFVWLLCCCTLLRWCYRLLYVDITCFMMLHVVSVFCICVWGSMCSCVIICLMLLLICCMLLVFCCRLVIFDLWRFALHLYVATWLVHDDSLLLYVGWFVLWCDVCCFWFVARCV